MAKKRAAKRRAWNKGIELGQKDAFTSDQVKQIRKVLERRGDQGFRDLALFAVAIDTMLQGPELLNLTVKDVRRSDGTIWSVIEVARRGQKPAVRCALSEVSANALRKWINKAGKKRTDYIFSGRGNSRSSHPMTVSLGRSDCRFAQTQIGRPRCFSAGLMSYGSEEQMFGAK